MTRYGAILADPPWAFRTYSGKHVTAHRCAEDHYQTMPLRHLQRIPVQTKWAAEDCALFLWVVDSHLDAGLDLIQDWGFDYKTIAFVWVKTTKAGVPRIGMGYWTRKSVELCLLGTRGKPRRLSKGVRQVIMEPRREHSRKPDEVRRRIEQLVAGPYLEMFARERQPGWDAWGDEVGKFA